MYNFKLFEFELYYVFLYFIIFSFLGWLMETIRVSIMSKKFVNRGFINGPFCPIYGIGINLIIIFLSKLNHNYIMLIIGGVILCSVLEYITSYVLETIFDAKWWDYSYRKFNLKGRICLDISCAWGILSFLMIKFVVPFINNLIDYLSRDLGVFIINVFFITFFIDLTFTVYSLLSLKSILLKFKKLRVEIKEYISDISENLRGQFDSEEIKIKIDSLINSYIKEQTNLFEETLNKIKDKFPDNFNEKLNIQEKFISLKNKYNSIYSKNINFVHKRVFKAFPKFHFKDMDTDNIISDIKDKLKNYKNNKKR